MIREIHLFWRINDQSVPCSKRYIYPAPKAQGNITKEEADSLYG